MLKRRKTRNDGTGEMPGQDSFLDIVSNIVGILIILVMIAGVRAQNSPPIPDEPDTTVETPPVEPAAPRPRYAAPDTIRKMEEQHATLEEKQQTAVNLRRSLDDVLEQTEVLNRQIQLQQLEHAELFDLLTAARAGIEAMAEEKNLETKQRIELQRQIQEIDAKLAQIDRTSQWIQANRPKATVMENIPTPISKTVEDKEAHFRLLGGKIVYVPITELLEKMKLEVASDKNRYFKQKSSTGRIGPIENFSLEFMLVSYDMAVRDAYGTGIGSRLEIECAEFLPTGDRIGQPLREALASPNSALLNRLKLYRQDVYTITVWVYPDSFEEFRELKQFLYAQGYRVAARPLEFGQVISGSAYGTKSESQ